MAGLGRKTRRLLALLVLISASLFLVFIFFATRSALDVWERLQGLPAPLFYAYSLAIAAFVLLTAWLIIKLLRGAKRGHNGESAPVDESDVLSRLAQAEQDGISTEDLRHEIDELKHRKATGRVYIALFGDVSTGKSSLIKALLPAAQVDISVRAGSTQEIKQYVWQSAAGDELVLTDLPGRNEADGALETAIEEEARRAQLVIYVCQSDLMRSQLDDMARLISYNKPLIICVNKSDRLSDQNKQQIESRIREQLSHTQGITPGITLAFVQSGGEEEVVQVKADGEEQTIARLRPAKVDSLAIAIQNEIDQQAQVLDQLRDASVFVLIQQKLDAVTAQHRDQQAKKIIKSSTKKAVFGALAAISPGSDIVIQGLVGSAMVKQLCKLHGAAVKDIDIDQFFDFSQDQVKKSVPLILAVSGNAMKAFPGIGTVTGGITHAFAYGLIFDALGRAVHHTLTQRGQLKPAPAALSFNKYLGENLSESKVELAKWIFQQSKK